MKKYLGIDVGGTNIKFALLNEEAEILEKGEIPTKAETIEEYIETLGTIYDQFPDVEALVMSAPGRIDSMSGYFFTGGALTFIHEMDMPTLLSSRIPIPFCAENDAKCAALAELWKGSMRNAFSGIVMTLGTGVGGGVILDGKLMRGANFSAGEFSCPTSSVDDHFKSNNLWGWKCSVRRLLKDYATLTGEDVDNIDGRIFFTNLNNGDKKAQEALDNYCYVLCNAIMTVQSILDVKKVAIGGGISRQPALLQTLSKQMTQLMDDYPSFMPLIRPEIVACEFGNDANLIGALYHYLYEYLPAKTQI